MKKLAGRKMERLATGIKGLDEVLGGGIPKGRALLITGTTGSGKTVFLNEYLYRGITEYGQNGIFVTFEETPEDILCNVRGFGWDYRDLVRRKKLIFEDISPVDNLPEELGSDYDLTPLIARIKYAAQTVRAKRVAIDMLGALFSRLKNGGEIRNALCRLSIELKRLGLTTLISAEKVSDEEPVSRFGVEDFVADAVIELAITPAQQQMVRSLYVRKVRGMGYSSGRVQFEITDHGIEVFPRIPVDASIAMTSFRTRKKIGIRALDAAMGGGVPQGHAMLISGNTGTGKTIMGLQFLLEGIRRGEKGVFVAMEESPSQLRKTALAHGWDIGKLERQGKFAFVTTGLIDISNDKLLYQVVRAVSALNAKRVVFDSISSLLSSSLDSEGVRQLLIQLTGFFKNRGITSCFTYLSGANFGASSGQLLAALNTNEMRLSSVMDGVLLLLYVERGQRVNKLLNILKLRGSKHTKEILEYEIEKGGLRLKGKFAE